MKKELKKELLDRLNELARGIIITLNGEQYVKDTETFSEKTYWFNMDNDNRLTDEEVVEIILNKQQESKNNKNLYNKGERQHEKFNNI